MNKLNKKVLLIVFAVILLTFVVANLVKSKATKLLVQKVEEGTGCQLRYGDLDVSLFTDFPNLYFNLKSFELQDGSETVLHVKEASTSLVLSRIFSNELVITNAKLVEPILTLNNEVTKKSSPSLVEEAQAVVSDDSSASSTPTLLLTGINIVDGKLTYRGEDSLFVTVDGITAQSSGSLDADSALLNLQVQIREVDYLSPGFSMIDIPVSSAMVLAFDSNSETWYFKENRVVVGKVSTTFKGSIALAESPNFDISFNAPTVNVSDVLALLPSALLGDASQFAAGGEVMLDGFIKGSYLGASSWPAFGVNFKVQDAWMQYADKVQKIEKVSAYAILHHPLGTPVDSTVLNVTELEMHSADNYIQGELEVFTPVSGVGVKGKLNGDIDFESLSKTLPLEASTLVGHVNTKVQFDGNLVDLENENYENFKASGFLKLSDYYIKNDNLPQGLSIRSASMNFTPEKIKLSNFSARLGTSDIALKGYLSNYFAYLFDNKALKGQLTLDSKYLNLNEFLDVNSAKSSPTKIANAKKTTADPSENIILPQDLQLELKTNVKRMIVDQLSITDCKGSVSIKNGVLHLQGLNLNMLGGKIAVSGQYNTAESSDVFTDVDLKVTNVEIAEAATSFTVLKQMMSKSQTIDGRLSADMTYYSKFDPDGNVNQKSIKSKGQISSPGLRVANNAALNTLAKQFNDDRYRDVTTSKIEVDYEMKDGVITFDPFDVVLVDKKVNAGGWYSIDDQINMTIKTTVKAKEIGGDVSKYIGMVSDVNKPLPVTVLLTGDAKKPTVKYDTREAISILRKDVSKNLNGDAVRSILKGFFK